MKKHLIIIDGYGFLFRAYHAMPPLSRSDGTPVGALFGFTSMLMKVLSAHECSHIAVALDSGVKSFRNQIFKEYKAHRPPAPDDLIPQFPLIRDAITALNVQMLEKVGFEADDLIASYATFAANNGFKVTIISSDKDLMQLIVDDKIVMYDGIKNKYINEKEVEEKFGVKPDKLHDVLSMMGDSSDNIPGIPGIGPKTAAELVLEYGSLDNIYKNTHLIKQPKRRVTIEDNKEMAYLSKKLIALVRDMEIEVSLEDLIAKDPILTDLTVFLEQQNFKSLLSRIKSFSPSFLVTTPVIVKKITNINEVKEVLLEAKNVGYLAINYVFEPKTTKITKVFLAVNKDSYQVDIASNELQNDLLNRSKDIFLNDLVQVLKPYLENESILKITYNLKQLLHDFKIDFVRGYEDLQLASYLVFNSTDLSLKNLINNYLHIDIEESQVNIGYFIEIWQKLKIQLNEQKMFFLYDNIEKKLIHTLYNIEKEGIKIDVLILKDLSSRFAKQINELEVKIYEVSGSQFNIGSPKQLAEILFNKMGISLQNKKSSLSTNAEVLEELVANGHVIAEYVLEWRHLSKLKNTYIDTLPKLVDQKSRIHTTFQMTTTSTGRLSSINPNLQNIPIRTKEGHLIRSSFVASQSKKLISADYSQIELRLLAHIANVEPLLVAFKNNLDIHKATASDIFNVRLENVDDDLRRKAKTINFGIIYGMSAFGLANSLKISRQMSKEYIELYFQKYPQIKEYMEKTKEFARLHGYVETLFGRKCYLNNINSKNAFERSFAERAAINAPLQGTQADIIKIAMNKISDKFDETSSSAKMILQIHDELLFEEDIEKAENTAKIIKNIMENIVSYKVDLTVNIATGNNWQDL